MVTIGQCSNKTILWIRKRNQRSIHERTVNQILGVILTMLHSLLISLPPFPSTCINPKINKCLCTIKLLVLPNELYVPCPYTYNWLFLLYQVHILSMFNTSRRGGYIMSIGTKYIVCHILIPICFFKQFEETCYIRFYTYYIVCTS